MAESSSDYTFQDIWGYGGWEAVWEYYLLPWVQWLGSGFQSGVSWSEYTVYAYDEWIGYLFFIASLALLALEGIRYLLKRRMSLNLLGDTLTNFVTFFVFIGIIIATTGIYLSGYYYIYEYFALFNLPLNSWSVLACIVLADLTYYWEHRFMHRCGLGWATHTVHHSSPHFNISVAYRFGPLDSTIPFFFHIPLLLLGFHPAVLIISEGFVQLYQTMLHTEAVGKFSRPVEAVMNTPSHHRVHHGSNAQYIDKNYAGIFIIWDKMFGTFAEEQEEVVYGITAPLNTVNPFVVFFHGFTRLSRQMMETKGLRNKLSYLVQPPGWTPPTSARK